jgi:biopolymer transport protein ExbD
MADLEVKDSGKGKKKGRKKMSVRVDLTPMVDLAFLLVTFFMLTTTFSKPQTMEINLPVKDEPGTVKPEDENAVKASKTITLILGADNKVYWYHGLVNNPIEGPTLTNYSADGLRKMLVEKNSTIDKMVVLIKPSDDAVYKNVVDVLDEMNISDIKRFALIDITPEDLNIIKKL